MSLGESTTQLPIFTRSVEMAGGRCIRLCTEPSLADEDQSDTVVNITSRSNCDCMSFRNRTRPGRGIWLMALEIKVPSRSSASIVGRIGIADDEEI